MARLVSTELQSFRIAICYRFSVTSFWPSMSNVALQYNTNKSFQSELSSLKPKFDFRLAHLFCIYIPVAAGAHKIHTTPKLTHAVKYKTLTDSSLLAYILFYVLMNSLHLSIVHLLLSDSN